MVNIEINRKLDSVAGKLSGEVFVIIDSNLKHLHGHFAGCSIIEVETSEQNKSLETVAAIASELLEKGANRDAFILGVGGGLTTDIAGFVASIYKRGVRFAFIPTTLLAQTDASIGGKNGVNFNAYKNILGVINQPEWIYICTQVLETLHPKEFRAGIAEVLKTFVLFDKVYYAKAVEYFTELENHLKEYGSYLQESSANGVRFYKEELLLDIIARCAEYKKGVVERDEFEKGERRLLNLGHTFAHSIEKICAENPMEYGPVMHGEAVAMGMVLAAKLSGKYFKSGNGFAERLAADLESVGLPVDVPANKEGEQIPMEKLVEALKKDKKAVGKGVHFIMPEGVGNVEDVLISFEQIEELCNDLC